ncbi:hypothetical protein FVEG_12145 [Fusarium verticillioides 7600]|uniref:Uncharacterized protein n=1 Tax=Gibberella moniliformis (strain M3125 / FGSC 7600) TaxID=334819 RepID=W7NBA8_GIBM7|nr:hypothetical protein FVEG_12145 [Fusarium verticillioides 7600]EWG53792.1 hypothetical protein FVEG_12145 [Fusarium verticillioides 7600]
MLEAKIKQQLYQKKFDSRFGCAVQGRRCPSVDLGGFIQKPDLQQALVRPTKERLRANDDAWLATSEQYFKGTSLYKVPPHGSYASEAPEANALQRNRQRPNHPLVITNQDPSPLALLVSAPGLHCESRARASF